MSRPEFTSAVVVRPLPEHTVPDEHRWAFTYTITIRNTGDVPAQLIARQWFITDHQGRVQQVRGLGVVGQQPLLAPGEAFEYTSWAQIGTAQGSMRGSLFGVTEAAEWFESLVAEFMLADSAKLH